MCKVNCIPREIFCCPPLETDSRACPRCGLTPRKNLTPRASYTHMSRKVYVLHPVERLLSSTRNLTRRLMYRFPARCIVLMMSQLKDVIIMASFFNVDKFNALQGTQRAKILGKKRLTLCTSSVQTITYNEACNPPPASLLVYHQKATKFY